VLDRPSFLRIFVEDERAVRWKIPDYGLSNGIALTCKAIYGWEFPRLFRGTPERLEDLDEVLPSSPTWIRQEGTKGFLLSKESFEGIYVASNLSWSEARQVYGVSHQVMVRAVQAYGEEFSDRLSVKKGRHISAGKRKPETFFPKEALVGLLDDGLSCNQIAARLGVGESVVSVDLHHHGIARNTVGSLSWLTVLSGEEMKALEVLNPAISVLPEDEQESFGVLVETYQRVISLSTRLKRAESALRSAVEQGSVERRHLTFSTNRAEMRLSRALIAAGIQHRRLLAFYKNWQADFAWPEGKLLVEVDGDWHRKDAATKGRDKRKEKKAKELGYRVLRFTTEDVYKRLPTVVRGIAEALGHELPESLRRR